MNDRVIKIIHHPLTIPVATGIVSFGVGVGVGIFIGRNRRKAGVLYELPQPNLELSEEDLAEIKEPIILDGDAVVFEDQPDDHQVIVEEVPEAIIKEDGTVEPNVSEFINRHLQTPVSETTEGEEEEDEETDEPTPQVEPEEDLSPVPQNIFAGHDDDWDQEEEEKNRSINEPYILHEDEFHAQEKRYSQTSCTYYEGDDILVDENEVPIYNERDFVGDIVLADGTSNFGHGSSDPNIFFVRNDKRRAEYEILRHTGLYSVEVAGLEIPNNQRAKRAEERDLRHSSRPGKFRSD